MLDGDIASRCIALRDMMSKDMTISLGRNGLDAKDITP